MVINSQTHETVLKAFCLGRKSPKAVADVAAPYIRSQPSFKDLDVDILNSKEFCDIRVQGQPHIFRFTKTDTGVAYSFILGDSPYDKATRKY
ncbi:hypothetical protein [Vibrio phage YC]|uniref:Uncharacterized protein n=1 Tax=Vibrio phage YC TaxID=2267403 RepID=A0A384ZSC3_9CAUD|nr:hypothetical protein HWB64_gp174 [Vibrio phage YC]AXC34543.1 hypothetical protein [Vibrio phage YC]